VLVWFVTFSLTVVADLTVAVEVGMILAALLFIRDIARTTTITEVTEDDVASGRVHVLQDKPIPDYVAVFRIHGPFLFGTTDKLTDLIARVPGMAPVVVLRLRNMTAIDGTGVRAIEEFADALHATGRHLIVCGAREQPRRMLQRAGVGEHIGPENLCEHIDQALARARQLYASGAVVGRPLAS